MYYIIDDNIVILEQKVVFEKNRKREHNKIAKKHQFLGLIIVCVVFVILSPVTIFMKRDGRSYDALKTLAFREEETEQCYDVLIDEDSTLKQISEANGMSLDTLYIALNIDREIDPKTKIGELFEKCDE